MLGSFWIYPFLLCTGVVAGLIDSIAGGGGLITLPVALAVGMPPKIALGTNKFQSSFGSFTATYYYVKHGIVSLRGAKLGIIFTLIGAAAGAWGVQQIDSGILNHVIPFLLLAIVIYTLLTPKFGDVDRPKTAEMPAAVIVQASTNFRLSLFCYCRPGSRVLRRVLWSRCRFFLGDGVCVLAGNGSHKSHGCDKADEFHEQYCFVHHFPCRGICLVRRGAGNGRRRDYRRKDRFAYGDQERNLAHSPDLYCDRRRYDTEASLQRLQPLKLF